MTRLRWIGVAIVLLVLAQSAVWVFAGSVWLSFPCPLVWPGEPEPVCRGPFWAIAMIGAAAINLIVLVPFLLRVRWGWLLLTLVQIADACVSLALLVAVSTDWWLVTTPAAITTLLLFAWRRMQPALAT